MFLHDDTHDPRRNESLPDGSAAAAISAEGYDIAHYLPAREVIASKPVSIPALSTQPLTLPALCLHKDPPLRRFGH